MKKTKDDLKKIGEELERALARYGWGSRSVARLEKAFWEAKR